jgi:hypothetical protein
MVPATFTVVSDTKIVAVQPDGIFRQCRIIVVTPTGPASGFEHYQARQP